MTSRPLRRAATTAALVAALGAGVAIASATAAAADDTLRLSTFAVHNTDLDLGDPGSSAGDVQVFCDDVRRGGRLIGISTGSCQVTELSETRLVAACTATVAFSDGSTLTSQGVFDEDLTAGPSGFRWAVTGGTGRYAGAGGVATGEFVPDTDQVDLTIRLR